MAREAVRSLPPASGDYFDDIEIGTRIELGAHLFTRQEIVEFARLYDPQPFHLDDGAAAESELGRLVASGWHTVAMWMRLYARHREAVRQAFIERGERPAIPGPSPGFRDMKWRCPVYPGDTIAYSSTVTGKRRLGRKGWGLVFHHNRGINQDGQLAVEFHGSVFWEKRPAVSASVPLEADQGTHRHVELAQLVGATEIGKVDHETGGHHLGTDAS